MSDLDTDKLKRLAELLVRSHDVQGVAIDCDDSGTIGQAILALIAENERLDGLARQLTRATYDARKQRDEAVALLREVVRKKGQDMTHNISYFLARIDDKGSE